jgi:hypothetical protein
MRWIAGLLLMGIAATALASSTDFDRFQSAVESKGAPSVGTFEATGKFKSLCACLDGTSQLGVIESALNRLQLDTFLLSVCSVPHFDDTGKFRNQQPCSPWTPITKP